MLTAVLVRLIGLGAASWILFAKGIETVGRKVFVKDKEVFDNKVRKIAKGKK